MAINKEKQVVASVILDIEVYEEIKRMAKEEKRSASSQMAKAIENMIKKSKKKEWA